ncbi:TIGR03767 family metallophosphoesterase [Pseudonocardia oroxyli]|uniref:Metallophosphoesterase, PPA1498 family n=1 Tax=Pseudonocardia oroxyli TaxID=366584 RepID=A0A1G7PT51_PSEOR|nr:TIGR03767 family metallophosphoesterase [Pseudonocardia oroxyli]SDF89418.1 metallophosphoesterase, PPA1498 family [Pseudonocardia oroxyli]
MAGLSRRGFLASVAALSAAWQLDPLELGQALAQQATPSTALSTLHQTILQGPVAQGRYRTLVAGPGEPYLPRLDVLRRAPDADRARARRSLLYLGHLSDMHVIDAQSPGRIEPMIVQDHSAWASAFHPQDPLTVHVLAAMTQALTDLRFSPLTGAPMGAAMVTGDSADMHSHHELRWYIDVLDGRPVTPDSGRPGVYEGLQAWSDAVWAYRPEDPAGGGFGDYGFPRMPGLLDRAIAGPVQPVGLPAPWYAVYGNHDTLLLGTFGISPQFRTMATGDRKALAWEALAADVLGGYAATASPLQRLVGALDQRFGLTPGFRTVTADSRRRIFEQQEFMAAHFDTAPNPGPVGHGFTRANLDSGETWWSADITPQVRVFGLDTCNQVAGPDGAVPDTQFRWLRAQLEQTTDRLVLVLSHHNSLTLENRALRPGATEVLHGAEEFVDLLLDFPNVVAWLNGHTHLNQILAHTRGDRGFWEITTASCIDFPQQQQVVELVDNRDGTMSIFTTVVDHASPLTASPGGSLADLAGTSRELAANDWIEDPFMRRGSPLDRNTELLLPAPFDLATITDAALEAQANTDLARMVAR